MGPKSNNFIFDVKQRSDFHIQCLTEVHLEKAKMTDFRAAVKRHHLDEFSVPAIKMDSGGNHAGSTILANQSLYTIPIPQYVLEQIYDMNSADPQWVAVEVRCRGMSYLQICSYFDCGSKLGACNWSQTQQICALIFTYGIPFVWVGDFNMTPEHIRESGLLALLGARLDTPDCDRTCTIGNNIIDFIIRSNSLTPLISTVRAMPTALKPHLALEWSIAARPRCVQVRRLVKPMPLPMELFEQKWKELSMQQQKQAWSVANLAANAMLVDKAITTDYLAILGQANTTITSDPKYQNHYTEHVIAGEHLAHTSLAIEMMICKVVGVSSHRHIGRSQFQKYASVPAVQIKPEHARFSCPAANFWGKLANALQIYACVRTNGANNIRSLLPL